MNESGQQPPQQADDPVYSVGELNRLAGEMLEGGFGSIWVTGELHEIRHYAGSGHWYFTLKDEQSELRGVMFKGDNQRVAQIPHQGDQLNLMGKLTIYGQRGQYQFVARRMEAAGEGLLLKRFEELRRRLTAEGLFADERKQALPSCPRSLAVVTSPAGAAVRDVLSVAARRAPLLPITLVPATVQGDRAPASICRSLDLLEEWNERSEEGFDAVLLCRGGGSLEDLWAFNEEAVVRRVAALKIPSVSGVGHETDFTLTDFAADLRAPTPSAGAEILTETQNTWPTLLQDARRQLQAEAQRNLERADGQLRAVQSRLVSPRKRLEQQTQRTDELAERIQQSLHRGLAEQRGQLNAMARLLLGQVQGRAALRQGRGRMQMLTGALTQQAANLTQYRTARLDQLQMALRSMNPLSVLQRGYAVVRDSAGAVRTDTSGLQVGDKLEVQLARGGLQTQIEKIQEEPEHGSE